MPPIDLESFDWESARFKDGGDDPEQENYFGEPDNDPNETNEGHSFKEWVNMVREYLIRDYMIPSSSFLLHAADCPEDPYRRMYDKGCGAGRAAYWIYNWDG